MKTNKEYSEEINEFLEEDDYDNALALYLRVFGELRFDGWMEEYDHETNLGLSPDYTRPEKGWKIYGLTGMIDEFIYENFNFTECEFDGRITVSGEIEVDAILTTKESHRESAEGVLDLPKVSIPEFTKKDLETLGEKASEEIEEKEEMLDVDIEIPEFEDSS